MPVLEAVRRVALLDDDPNVRLTYAEQVIDANLEPVPENSDHLGTLTEYMSRERRADAALTDYNLYSANYAAFNGAQLVEALYDVHFPAVLCTRFEKTHVEQIRPLRRKIPVILTPDTLNQDSLLMGLEDCVLELQGNFKVWRRPWRTQVHFLDEPLDELDGTLLASVPGWGLSEAIRVRVADLPTHLRGLVGPGVRCHASVNLGAESAEDLYLCDWESP